MQILVPALESAGFAVSHRMISSNNSGLAEANFHASSEHLVEEHICTRLTSLYSSEFDNILTNALDEKDYFSWQLIIATWSMKGV